jgi:MFS family permease
MSQHHCSRCFVLFGLHLRPFRTTYFHPYRRDNLPRRLNHPDIHAQPYCPHRRPMHPRSRSWHTIRDGPYLPMRNCPGHGRGLFVAIEYLCLNAGYALSTWVGYAFFFYIPHEISWRGPYIIQACVAITLVIWTFFLPETPRWLIKNGFQRQGMLTLADLHAKGDIYDPLVTNSYASIQAAITLESHIGEATWSQLFTQYTRRAVVGITCQLFAQFNGINAILYFLPENLTRERK